MNRDVWYSIALKADDKDILNMLIVNKKFNEPEFFQTVFRNKYPLLEKFKRKDQSWKDFYLTMIKYIHKLKEDYSFEYVPAPSLNPKFLYCDFVERKIDEEDVRWKHIDFSGETGEIRYLEKYLTKDCSYEDQISIFSGICLSGNSKLFQDVIKILEERNSLDFPQPYYSEFLENAFASGNMDLVNLVKKYSNTNNIFPIKDENLIKLRASIRRKDYQTFLLYSELLTELDRDEIEKIENYCLEYDNLDVIKYLLSKNLLGKIGILTEKCMIYDREEILKYFLSLKEDLDINTLIFFAEKYDNEHLIVILAENIHRYHMYDDTYSLLKYMEKKEK